jgi:hypothetical protein
MQLNNKQLENFFKKVNKIPDGCWLWIGSRSFNGYGNFNVGGKTIGAHRISFEIHKGEIPEGLQIDHICKKRGCVRPDHLEVVTQRENLLRSNTVAFINSNKTHCPQGHQYTPENIYKKVSHGKVQGRKCKTCTDIFHHNYRLKLKAS